jgi:hypothetical protein
MLRRRFIFWLSFGMFTLSEKLRFGGLDRLAAATMRLAESKSTESTKANSKDATASDSSTENGSTARDVTKCAPEHWTAKENNTWQWFERETLVDGKWKLTGVSTPLNKQTGEPLTGRTGYLDTSVVPQELLVSQRPVTGLADDNDPVEPPPHVPTNERRARHGRPPSRWLRSLNADELRIWLKTIDPPEAGVSGMTYWTHLTRDHFFNATKIAGLTIDEQAKLHAAAHYGY